MNLTIAMLSVGLFMFAGLFYLRANDRPKVTKLPNIRSMKPARITQPKGFEDTVPSFMGIDPMKGIEVNEITLKDFKGMS